MAKRTPLYEAHLAAGARMIEFAGFDMPVQYKGLVEEHLAVREGAGIFDVSHMGEIVLEGPRALAVREPRSIRQPGRQLERKVVRRVGDEKQPAWIAEGKGAQALEQSFFLRRRDQLPAVLKSLRKLPFLDVVEEHRL